MKMRGISIIEVVVVIAILGLISIMFASGYTRLLNARRFNQAVDGITDLYSKGRNLTLASKDSVSTGMQYGIHVDQSSPLNRVRLFSTSGYSAANTIDTFVLPPGVSISAFSFPACGCSDFAFERLTGNVVNASTSNTMWTGSGTISVQSAYLATTTIITIFPSGAIKTY